MASVGRISLLVDSPLPAVMAMASRLEPNVRRQINQHTKRIIQPVWSEVTRANSTNRQRARLAASAVTGVTNRNVFLRAGGRGKIGQTPLNVLAYAIEFGALPDKQVSQRSRNGRSYTRRLGYQFGLPRERGYVIYPAAKEAIPRIASLWVQTTVRTVYEEFEKVT